MINTFTKRSTTSFIAAMLIGCGGGGGTPATTVQNQDSTVGNTSNTQNPAPQTGNDTSTTVTNSTLCGGAQTAFALSKEVNGDLNIEKDNTEDCYKIHLSSNNAEETYTFFLNMLPGTEGFTVTDVRLIDMDNEETPFITKNKMYQADTHLRKTFTVTKDGTYYIMIKRGTSSTKYAFSLHPSVENGLVQNKDKEINDTPSMAAPITLEEAMKDITGSLHVTRDAYNSLRNSDDTDYYSIDIKKAGKYTFFMNLLPGTEGYRSIDVRFIDENEGETPITTNTNTFSPPLINLYYYNIRKEITLSKGKHKIKVYRDRNKVKYAFSLYPSIINGLKQDSDREPNDAPSMAAPLTMAEITSGIIGSLHFTRDVLNSLRKTDDVDMYRIPIEEAGIYTIDMELLPGSKSFINIKARFISDSGTEIPISSASDNFDSENERHSVDVRLAAGAYNLKISRSYGIAKYSFKMTKKN
ncbi:MAG: hypothetical protein L3J43_08680 [Sulfurovum sp.]|nr:hypothetical protein [Sulfurovum sp.]